MTTVNAYLTFKGNCEEAFEFYRSAFKGEFQFIGRYKDLAQQERQNFSSEEDDKIMHVSLPISRETILMGCDMQGQEIVKGNNITLSINTDSKAEADRLFNALSAGGEIKMPMTQTFWGSYFGLFTDKFGIQWTVSADSTEEK